MGLVKMQYYNPIEYTEKDLSLYQIIISPNLWDYSVLSILVANTNKLILYQGDSDTKVYCLTTLRHMANKPYYNQQDLISHLLFVMSCGVKITLCGSQVDCKNLLASMKSIALKEQFVITSNMKTSFDLSNGCRIRITKNTPDINTFCMVLLGEVEGGKIERQKQAISNHRLAHVVQYNGKIEELNNES
jgi:hypothetical protein